MSRRRRYAPNNLPRRWHWVDDAACSGMEDAETFFPVGTNGVPARSEIEYAKSFCDLCPVRSDCLTHALTAREEYGIWGGLDERERADLARQTRLAADRQRRHERDNEKAAAAAAAATVQERENSDAS